MFPLFAFLYNDEPYVFPISKKEKIIKPARLEMYAKTNDKIVYYKHIYPT